MSVMVIVAYRPKPGKGGELEALVREHHGVLKAQGLVDDDRVIAGRAADGAIVEVFVWKSQAAIDSAHENPEVQKMWAAFAEACDYEMIANVAEAGQLFSPLTPIDLG